MADLDLITRRYQEVGNMIANYRKNISELESELVDLDTAGKVVARLSGAKWPPVGEANQLATSVRYTGAEALDRMTMPMMIVEVLKQAHRQGLKGLTPKDMSERIKEKFSPEVKSDYVASIAWRVSKQGKLVNIGGGVYALPEEKEATDLLSGQDQSGASDSNPAQGGEARPGGGT